MKDLSKLFSSKEREHIFWKTIIQQFSVEGTERIFAIPTEESNTIQLLIIDNFSCSYDDEEEFLLWFKFKNYINNSGLMIGEVVMASINNIDYQKFINNSKKFKNFNFDDGIEILKEDIPLSYRLLG